MKKSVYFILCSSSLFFPFYSAFHPFLLGTFMELSSCVFDSESHRNVLPHFHPALYSVLRAMQFLSQFSASRKKIREVTELTRWAVQKMTQFCFLQGKNTRLSDSNSKRGQIEEFRQLVIEEKWQLTGCSVSTVNFLTLKRNMLCDWKIGKAIQLK